MSANETTLTKDERAELIRTEMRMGHAVTYRDAIAKLAGHAKDFGGVYPSVCCNRSELIAEIYGVGIEQVLIDAVTLLRARAKDL